MNLNGYLKITIAALFSLFAFSDKLHGQFIPDGVNIGTDYSFVPVLGYTSDIGLFGGGVMQRINYRLNEQPFHSLTSFQALVTTRRNFITKIDYERVNSFGSDIRSRFLFEGQRIRSDTFFGIGNTTTFSTDEYDEGNFYYENRSVDFRYWGRKSLSRIGENGTLDGQFLATISYNDPVSRGDHTIFSQLPPPGGGGGWVNQLGFGIILESRDSEFIPTSGIRFETGIGRSTSLLGSDFSFTRFRTEARAYYSPIRNVVIAQKIEFDYTSGNTPFWELPVVGSNDGLRGYALNRFRGDSSILHIIELRSWLFSFLDDYIRVGAQTFMDTGRVFSGEDSFGDITSDLKQTYGFGGAFSFFNPDLFFRADIAFSEDLYRIYFGFGYLF